MQENQPEPQPVVVKKEIEKELLTWTAPARPFQRRSKDFYVQLIAVCALIGVVLFIIEGFMPVILLVSVVFLFYVMSTIPPTDIEYKITNFGVRVGESKTEWALMGRYWFTNRANADLLVVEIARIPGRMELVIKEDLKPQIKKTLDQYLVHEEVSPTMMDKMASWATKALPKT